MGIAFSRLFYQGKNQAFHFEHVSNINVVSAAVGGYVFAGSDVDTYENEASSLDHKGAASGITPADPTFFSVRQAAPQRTNLSGREVGIRYAEHRFVKHAISARMGISSSRHPEEIALHERG